MQAPGPDAISNKFIKIASPIISKPVTKIFNLSLATGIFPEPLKLSRVTPIYKSDTKTQVSNYRPISLISFFAKTLEKIVFNQLSTFLIDNSILYDYQFGFRKNHSTALALVEITDRISKALDENKTVCGLFIDFSKAFDTVDHQILLEKLEYYGIKNTAHAWFSDYLSNRMQYVEIDGHKSDSLNVTYGVPQGSTLGPLLFLLYINDLPLCSTKLIFRLFADDTNVFLDDSDLDNIERDMNRELNKVSDWLNANKLSLNLTKSNYMLLIPRNRRRPRDLNLFINGHKLARKSEVKYLGVFIDERLNWKFHIDLLTKKLNKIRGVIYRLSRYASRDVLMKIYFSLVYSYLNYGVMSWGGTYKSNLLALQRAQNKIVKTILGLPWDSPTNPVFCELDLLKVQEIYHCNCLTFIYKYHYDLLPPAFCAYFNPIHNIHHHNTRFAAAGNYYLPTFRTDKVKHSTSYTAITQWRDLPRDLKERPTLFQYKKYLKKHLLHRYH